MVQNIFNIVQSDAVGGGMENIFLEYSQIINDNSQQNKTDLVCIVSKKFCHLKTLQEQNIKVEFLNISGHFDIFSAIKLHFLIKKYSPKLIIAHNGRSFACINLCKKIFSFKKLKTKLKILAVSHGGSIKRIINFDYIIAVAKHIEQKIINSKPKGITTTIYNGYKISPHTKNITKNLQQKDHFTFGILSRLTEEKDTDKAIKVFKKFNDEVEENSLLIIAGEGKEKIYLEKLSKEYGLTKKVIFLGWVRNKTEFFNQIDIYIQPCPKESFGMTILEAFNYQTPVIACNAFGPKEIIKNDYSGYLFDPKDEESLFLTMKKSYLQKDQSQKIAKNANQELKEKFSHQIMEKQLLEFIQKPINN
jgi:glycosyltransferase involved in cell wall biosynthesis